MGCPGVASTNSTSAVRIGAVTWSTGYNYPTLYGSNTFTDGQYMDVIDNNINPSNIENNTSCSCLCAGDTPGLALPMFLQVASDNYMADWGWYPGGTTGIWMNYVTSDMHKFNIGQSQRCSQIYTGLYELKAPNTTYMIDAAWTTTPATSQWISGVWPTDPTLVPTFQLYLWGSATNPTNFAWSSLGTQPSPTPGGFPYISLCLSSQTLGATLVDPAMCPMSSCVNSMDYGTGIGPSVPIPGGHDLLDDCDVNITSTVWDTCEDVNCSPNGNCLGPPAATQPTGCISANSPLNGGNSFSPTTPDNVCFDCEGAAIFHPCYASGTDNTTLWNGASNVWESPAGVLQLFDTAGGTGNGYGGCETMGWGLTSATVPEINDYDPDPLGVNNYFGDHFMQQIGWDQCCTYLQFGCADPNYANFNNATNGNNGLDCAGNPDPANYTYIDSTTFVMMCNNIPWMANTFTYLDSNGGTQTATQPAIGPAQPCINFISNSVANPTGHPYAWNKTNYKSADACCCSDAGCLDDGTGVLSPWTSTPPLDRYTLPWTSLGGALDVPYYPGYDVMIGVISPINLTQNPQSASNYCGGCTEDCNGDAPGTYNAGWANCCMYQIGGCTDASNVLGVNHPDIYGNGTYDVWNYNPLATLDDGSCFIDEPVAGCMDDGGLQLNTIGLPPFPTPENSGIPASNFNPIANINAGGCTFDEACPDPFATNYNPCADPNNYAAIGLGGPPVCMTTNGGTAWIAAGYNLPPYNWAWVDNLTLCLYDIPGAGPGCMDPQAINYNPLATTDCDDNSGAGPYPEAFWCCTYPTEGCTDPNAWNYNTLAMIDDGSCEYVITPFQDEVNFLNGTPVLLCRTPLTKEEALMNVAEPPEIQSEIFIERGKQSVMEPNQRLGEIKTMGGLVNYAYGYYKIK